MEALLVLVVVGIAAGVVLRDVAAYERPPREKRPPRPPRAERPERAKAPRGAALPVERLVYEADGSVLGALATTEHDERSAARRVVSALVLLTLTLLTAGLIGAGIYRGLSGFGK